MICQYVAYSGIRSSSLTKSCSISQSHVPDDKIHLFQSHLCGENCELVIAQLYVMSSMNVTPSELYSMALRS